MKLFNSLIFSLVGLMMALASCNDDVPELIGTPDQETDDNLEFYSVEYDFNKKEIKNILSPEFKESLTNNSDQIVPINIYPYFNQASVEFSLSDSDYGLDGLEYEIPIPSFQNDTWSEAPTDNVKVNIGGINNFNPENGDLSFTLKVNPRETLKYSFKITLSQLTVPFVATFVGDNHGKLYKFSGELSVSVPTNFELKIEED